MNKLIVGQIGCGAFAEDQDLPNFAANPKTEVKWCCDISRERAQLMADKFGIPEVTSDFMEVINDPEVDMIKICTSHEVHLPIIEAASAAGKHIFCEKPMAMHQEESYKIISAVRKNNVKMCVDLNRRMAPAMQALRNRWLEHKENPVHHPWRYVEVERDFLPEELRTEFLIRVQDESISYRLVHQDPVRGGGQIIGESVHWIDLVCWFFAPAYPVEIQAWGSTRLSHGIHITFSNGDNATIILNCGGTFDYPKELFEVSHNGALFRSQMFVENNYYGIQGVEKEIFPMQRDSEPEVGKAGGFDSYMEKYQTRVRNLTNVKSGHGSFFVDKGHERMIDVFADSILEDKPSPCDEMAGYLSTFLSKLAIKSIDNRAVLPVPVEKVFPCIV